MTIKIMKIILALGLLATSLLIGSWEVENKIAIEDFKHAKPNPCFVQNKDNECYQHLAEQDKQK